MKLNRVILFFINTDLFKVLVYFICMIKLFILKIYDRSNLSTNVHHSLVVCTLYLIIYWLRIEFSILKRVSIFDALIVK